ncbi:DUF234 domain-containing protein [Campylobacter sp.]|uniref:DUF234 domain-containing protein n=1 Tax=Campylobacter sp. TaxID=205 RepID=UPI0026DC8E11|nr:DUF234 domain-containing protein [Campylobacter sp.]MDO4673791.1 DUF234 domain-containing protein [Campylobacter sp.]
MVDFYSVFDGFEGQNFSGRLFEDIENLILKNYNKLPLSSLDKTSAYALTLLAKNNRKRYSINAKIKHFKALNSIHYFLNSHILSLEKSKEEKLIKNKNQKVKKELRAYTVQDKLIFCDHFTRFYFYFLKPNEELILRGEFEEVLRRIRAQFELYQSFCFEQLAREFLEKYFGVLRVESYWDRKIELDLYFRDEKLCFIGEVKFKNKKICKNILNQLHHKAKMLNLRPDYYIIFSKNGFSAELEKMPKNQVLLFDLNDFARLL